MDRKTITIEPDPVIEVYKKDIDMTLIDENLKLSIEERLRKLFKTQKLIEELRRATREASHDRL